MADSKSTTGMPLPDAVAGNFQEAVRWFNQMWSGGGDAAARTPGPIPSALMPTLDVQELDKRIADLRSVERWLQLNQGLLQTTIQGLEMQRNTLSAWQSFGAATAGVAAAAATANTSSAKGPPAADTSAAPPFDPTLWWASLQQQFAQMAAAASAGDGAMGSTTGGGPASAGDAAASGTGSGKGSGGKAAGKPRGAGSAED
jgi:hypothetical protein